MSLNAQCTLTCPEASSSILHLSTYLCFCLMCVCFCFIFLVLLQVLSLIYLSWMVWVAKNTRDWVACKHKLVSHILEIESLRLNCWHGWILVSILFGVLMSIFFWVLVSSSLGFSFIWWAAKVREQAKISSHQGINSVHEASTLMVLSPPLSTNSRCFKGTWASHM